MRQWIFLPVVALLSGCQLNHLSPANDLYAQKGYLCTAGNGASNTAWAREQQIAADYALSRCQSHSRHPGRCKITSCFQTGSVTTVSTARWYTCYVSNHQRHGVWSATAHKRLDAIQWSYDRCVRYSGKASRCYVSYCRLW